MKHPKRMVALGAICTTAIFRVPEIPRPPAKVLATQRCTVVDGMAISAACAFQKLGGQAQVWARVGQDAEADAMRQALALEGVDTRGLHTVLGARSSTRDPNQRSDLRRRSRLNRHSLQQLGYVAALAARFGDEAAL